MNRTTVFALVGAFFTAFLIAVLISASMSGKNDKSQNAPTATVPVLFAAKDMPIGSTLAENNVVWQEWPKDKVFANAIIKDKEGSDKIIGKKLRRSLLKDEPITPSALIGEAKGGYLAAALEPGMRAVTIKTDAPTGVAGFAVPGDRVDVLLVYAIKVQTDDPKQQQKTVVKYTTETVLSDIRVLALDQRSDSAGGEKIQAGKTVTLEVDAAQAEKLMTAQAMGRLQLALRKMGENTPTNTDGTTDVSVSKTLQKAVGSVTGGVSSGNVRMYSRTGVSDISIRGGTDEIKQDGEEDADAEGSITEGEDE